MIENPFVMVDIESDGPCPGLFSMVSLGAIIVEDGLSRTFYAQFRPISDNWVPEALAVSGHTREECMAFPDPKAGMEAFEKWLKKEVPGRPLFISDNNGFDWQFVNYYFWMTINRNPFGYSSTNLGSLYKGYKRDFRLNFKHLRKTKHSHHPVDDARGNAEALLSLLQDRSIRVSSKTYPTPKRA